MFYPTVWGVILLVLAASPLHSQTARPAPDVSQCRTQFLTGNYTNAIRTAEEALLTRERGEEWPILLTQSLNAVGRYPEAQTVISNAVKRYGASIRLRLVAYHTYLKNGQRAKAVATLNEINELGGSRGWAYQDPPNLVALGQAALLLGGEPRRVLELFFDRARKSNPQYREAYLATGELALEKEDYEVAAKSFADGLKLFPEDADLLYGLARSYSSTDRKQMVEAIGGALTANTNHIPAMMLMIDHFIDAEQYGPARKFLDRALTVNPVEPLAWAYLAVIDHLQGHPEAEAKSRSKALTHWADNPAVDHLIGKKLSQKYRFQEGASCQRQALEHDKDFLPAKIQLAQDLLRLGEEDEGWMLAKAVYEKDAYNVAAYNLITLHDNIGHFQTLTNTDFLVRMEPHEARVYGRRVQNLLSRAKTNLCAKYGLEISAPVLVEIFPDQKDFAVRTFGMPGGEGFLGVCFGSVITANSPASQAIKDSNWEAILWHEFCHVITLSLTRNRMPRWLSEGISVFEEVQANPGWGQKMTPRYRQMILEGELTAIKDLSAAFLAPASDEHLQFAYFQSALVVDFLLGKFGLDSFKKLLAQLRAGVEINQALENTTATMADLERDFSVFAKSAAEALAPGLDWTKPDRDQSKTEALSALLLQPKEKATLPPPVAPPIKNSRASSATNLTVATHPEETKEGAGRPNFYTLTAEAKGLLVEKKWEAAKGPLLKLLELYPEQTGPNSGYSLLALIHRTLGETNLEKAVLLKLAARDAEAPDAYQRLMEYGTLEKDWEVVMTNAERYLAVDPLTPAPYRYLAESSEALERPAEAIEAWRSVLALDQPGAGQAHYRLARLLKRTDASTAKRHVLQALEEAPRFRDAQRLLLELDAGRLSPPGPNPFE